MEREEFYPALRVTQPVTPMDPRRDAAASEAMRRLGRWDKHALNQGKRMIFNEDRGTLKLIGPKKIRKPPCYCGSCKNCRYRVYHKRTKERRLLGIPPHTQRSSRYTQGLLPFGT